MTTLVEAVPLDTVRKVAKVRVVRIAGGLAVQSRLTGLGLRPGAVVEMRRNDAAGPLVLGVQNTRLAVGRGMAAKIMVLEIEHGHERQAE